MDELKQSYSEIKALWRGHTFSGGRPLFKILDPGPNLDWSINRPQPSAGIDAIIPMSSSPFHIGTWRDFQSYIFPDRLVYVMLSEENLRSKTPPGGFGISKLVRSRSSILRRGGAQMLSFSLIRTFATHHSLLHTSFPLDPSFFNRNQTFS